MIVFNTQYMEGEKLFMVCTQNLFLHRKKNPFRWCARSNFLMEASNRGLFTSSNGQLRTNNPFPSTLNGIINNSDARFSDFYLDHTFQGFNQPYQFQGHSAESHITCGLLVDCQHITQQPHVKPHTFTEFKADSDSQGLGHAFSENVSTPVIANITITKSVAILNL